MRVAVVGSDSLLAQALVRRAAGAGWCMARFSRRPREDAIHFDLRRPAPIVDHLRGCDRLVLCASSFETGGFAQARLNIETNVLGVLDLLTQAAEAGVPHVTFISSISALAPHDSYGGSKAAAEGLVRELCAAAAMGWAIVRPAQMYDADGRAAAHQRFLYFLIDRLAAGDAVSLYGRRDVRRNYVHVDDVAEGLLDVLRRGQVGEFNAVHPASLSVREAATAIRRAFRTSGAISFDPDKPDMAEIVIPEDHNLFAATGVAPRSFAEGLAEIRERRAAAPVMV